MDPARRRGEGGRKIGPGKIARAAIGVIAAAVGAGPDSTGAGEEAASGTSVIPRALRLAS
ncbi:MAG TPA: hypothetical protein VEM39_09460 [Myxococcaceae bacterium]|nr:hypothetical protein [Myxococcaceae bacterium]